MRPELAVLRAVVVLTPALRWRAFQTSVLLGLVGALEAGTFWILYTLLQAASGATHGQVGGWLAAMGGIVALRAAAGYLAGHQAALLEDEVLLGVRERLFERLQGVAIAFHDRTPSGALLHTLGGEVAYVKWVVSAFGIVLAQAMLLPVYAALLLALSWRLAIASTLLFSLALLVYQAASIRIRACSVAHADAQRHFIQGVSEWLRGIRTVHANGATAWERERFSQAARGIGTASVALADQQISRMILGDSLTLLAAAAILLGAISGLGLPLVDVLAFQMVLLRSLVVVKRALSAWGTLGLHFGAIRSVAELLRAEGKPALADGDLPFTGLARGITFRNVTFGYAPELPVVQGLDLAIPKGCFTALVGASGGGKSTIAHLLLRFYDPQAGQIEVDGHDLREYQIDAVRRRIAIVSQDTFLFDASIRANIAYGLPAADDEAIRAAALAAGALDFIEAMPDGLDALVGERGARLSAGQCQRIAIARAILRDPDLLILDEATSALDSVSEQVVQASIERLAAGRTVLAIAHQLSTIVRADRIAVLEDGRIVEEGTFEQLSALGGAFSRFLAANPAGGLVVGKLA